MAILFDDIRNHLLGVLIILLFCYFALPNLAAQNIPVGEWRSHLTYYDARLLAWSSERVYAASGNALFYWDRQQQQVSTLSQSDGLSDISVSCLGYDAVSGFLVVGYENGNIDLVSDDEVINIRSILNETTIRDKRLNHVSFHENKAYLSSQFGIVVLDMQILRISQTYRNLNAQGNRLEIFNTVVFRDRLYAATAEGVRSVSLSPSVNPRDFANWQTLSPTTGSSSVSQVTATDTHLYFALRNDGLYRYDGNAVEAIGATRGLVVTGLSAAERGRVWLAADTSGVFEVSSGVAVRQFREKFVAPQFAFEDPEGLLWIADRGSGLLGNESGDFEAYFPSGPYSAEAHAVLEFEDKILVVSGGYSSDYRPRNSTKGFYVFERGEWTNYNSEGILEGSVAIPALRDLIAATYSPLERRIYLASFQDGILVWDLENDSFSQIDSSNSPLRQNQVADVKVDASGNLWVAPWAPNRNDPTFYRKNLEGSWQSYNFGFDNVDANGLMLDIAEQVWARLRPDRGGNVLIFDAERRSRVLTETFNEGNLPSFAVRSLLSDRRGTVWIGTNEGIRVVFDVFPLLNNNAINASDIFFENRRLLRDERIISLKSDGGNRKWIATNNGAWLFDANGSRLFHHFTAENSPLLSNQVLDLGIIGSTGEVFFATALGLVSYRGTATDATRFHQQVKVFPNPVRPAFQGLITIEGLASNAEVKITDIEGKLIFETRAFGGTATWDGRSYLNQKASTGVYLIFSSTSDGEDTFVAKVAIIE
ncbi:MAG: hypothetical protein JJT94_04780 [Bernardetiaceae bacterium]|nr:hypothetical protein [Bernardetiaceae bacterium]